MKVAIKTRVSVAAVAIGLAIAAGPFSANHAWGSYHWARTANPSRSPSATTSAVAWDSYLNTAITDWSASTVLNLRRSPAGPAAQLQGDDGPHRGLQRHVRQQRLARHRADLRQRRTHITAATPG